MIKLISYILLILVITGSLGYFFYKQGIKQLIIIEDEKTEFTIKKNQSINTIAQNLKDNKIINSTLYFKLYIWQKNLDKKLKAGTHTLNTSSSIIDTVSTLINGATHGNEVTIKIIEGWTNQNIIEYLKKNNHIKPESLALLKKPIKELDSDIKNFNFLKLAPEEATLEGYLFPDTYKIFKNTNVKNIIIKTLKNFESKLSKQMIKDIKNQNKTLHEIIIMASLIEKEVQSPEDMKKISAIFWNRLDKDIKLESDATLSYLLKDKIDAHSLVDLKIDSPYNSYKYKGLPPTPISNPGLNALEAAIYPDNNEYLFFLTGKNGVTYFAHTYEEHLLNKNKYLK